MEDGTIEDVPWPPLDWEPPPLREDELTVLEGPRAVADTDTDTDTDTDKQAIELPEE